MNNIVNGTKLFQEKYIQNMMKRLEFEIELLHKWMKDTYSKFHVEVDVEFSKIRRTLYIRTRLYDRNKQRIQDRDSFLNMIKIEEKMFMNSTFMTDFLRALNEQYRAELTRLINNYRHLELLESA